MNYRISEIQKALSPNPFGLLTTLKPNGKTNIMAVSWWMFVSNNPPTIAVSLSKKGYSGELIRNTGEFALNIVGENLKETGFLCGTCSGRKEEKAEKFGISLIPAQKVLPEVIQDSKAVMECKLVGEYSATDHNIFVGEIIEIHFDPKQKQLFAWNGYGELGTVSKNN